MPVSTRRMRARWPPVDESAGMDVPMTLPPELYWNYIRPFTPVMDRAILNKRTGSTRFYAGDRVQVDEQYLEENHKACRGYKGIPVFNGKPGSRQLRIHVGSTNVECRDALAMLIRARKDWDTHMSKIESPSERLKNCLSLLGRDYFAEGCPLLFCGEGKVEDVVTLHASMNWWSINGPPTNRYVFPNTQLGYWVDRYLASVIEGIMEDFDADGPAETLMEGVITALLDAGADVTPFSEPVHTVHFHSNATGRFHGAFYLQRFGPGANALQCMKEFSESFEDPYTGNTGIDGLDWVVEQLEVGIVMTRFFQTSEKYHIGMETGRFGIPAAPDGIASTPMDLIAYELGLSVNRLCQKIVDEWNFVRDPRSRGDLRSAQVFYHPDFDPNNIPTRPLRKLDEDDKKAVLARYLPNSE